MVSWGLTAKILRHPSITTLLWAISAVQIYRSLPSNLAVFALQSLIHTEIIAGASKRGLQAAGGV